MKTLPRSLLVCAAALGFATTGLAGFSAVSLQDTVIAESVTKPTPGDEQVPRKAAPAGRHRNFATKKNRSKLNKMIIPEVRVEVSAGQKA